MGLQRNAPCPCGSGIKRKKCCGTVVEDDCPPELFRMMRVIYDLRDATVRLGIEDYSEDARQAFGLAMMDVEVHSVENGDWFLYVIDPMISNGITIWSLLEYRSAPGQPTAIERVYDQLKAKYDEVHRPMLGLVANSPMRLLRVTAFDSQAEQMEVEFVDDGADGQTFPVPNVFGVEPGDLVALRLFGLYAGKANYGQEFLRFPAEKANVVLSEYAQRHRDQAASICLYRSYFRHVWVKPAMQQISVKLDIDNPDDTGIWPA